MALRFQITAASSIGEGDGVQLNTLAAGFTDMDPFAGGLVPSDKIGIAPASLFDLLPSEHEIVSG